MMVSPKSDCPHIVEEKLFSIKEFNELNVNSKCGDCDEIKENWVCLTCGKLFCSRYIKRHFIKHHEENEDHCLGLSLLDLSFWCYKCDSYIVNKLLKEYYTIANNKKFGEGTEFSLESLSKMMNQLNLSPLKVVDIKYQKIVDFFKTGKFKSVSFLTGAGISTSCGIPDFRSQGGLFESLKTKYDLKAPEEFFSLDFFKKNPKLFYEFAKSFDIEKYKPSVTHYFQKFIEHKGLLNLIYTQNIDGLELKAGISKEKLVFCHGNMQESHCFKCKVPKDHKKMLESIEKQEILKCEKCKMPCKLNVVFYGEALPPLFFEKQSVLEKSDIVFIMGTSLKVSPFNMMPFIFKKETHRVVVNNEKVGEDLGLYGFDNNINFDDIETNDLFVEGFTDEALLKLIEDIGWKNEFEEVVAKWKN